MMVRAITEGSAAAVATAVLWSTVPDSSLFSVLIVLPGTIFSMAILARWIVRAGGEPLDLRWSSIEAISVLSLAILALAGNGLGAFPNSVIVGGFGMVLATRVTRMMIAARSCVTVGKKYPAALFFAIPLVVYCGLLPWSTEQRQPDGDEPFYLLVTHSLVTDFDLDLTNDYENGWQRFMDRQIEPQIGDPTGPHGELYSRHSAALPLILAPAYALAGRLGAMLVMATMAAALAWMALRLALLYGVGQKAALAAYSVMAFSSPLLVFSSQIWAEIPAALLLAIGLEQIRRVRGVEHVTPRKIVWFFIAILLLPVLKMRFAALSLSLVVVFVLRSRSSRATTLAVAGSLAVAAVVLAIVNYSRSGRVLWIYSLDDILLTGHSVSEGIRGLSGIFFDCAFGLVPAAPVWVLLLPAGWTLARRHRRSVIDALIVAAPYTIAITPRIEWYGGWSPPFRYFVVLLPLAALAIAGLFADQNDRLRPGLRFVLGAAVAATVVLSMVWIIVPGWTYNFADGGNHLLDRYGQRLGLDLVRFFPSMTRLRLASVLWPLALLAIVPLARIRKWPLSARGPSAACWGALFLLLSTGVLVTAARKVPTSIVEAEDSHVRRVDARLVPDLYTQQRGRFRGGLSLREGASFVAPVVADGVWVHARVWARTTGRGSDPVLRVSGGGPPRTLVVENGRWQRLVVGPLEWSPGSPLVVASEESADERRRAVVVDRVDLEWLARDP